MTNNSYLELSQLSIIFTLIQNVQQPDNVGRVSFAAESLCLWVRAMELYGRIFRVVEPKRQRLNAAMEQLAEKQASLQAAKDKLAAVNAKIEELKQDVC